MAIEFNHETNDIVNSTGQVKFNGTAVGGDNTPPEFFGERALSAGGVGAGGSSSTTSNVIQYMTIDTTGNSTDFGDLNAGRYQMQGCAGEGRGIFAGGYNETGGGGGYNNIQYVTISTPGNATDFGDLSVANRMSSGGGCSNGLRGLFGGGGSGFSDMFNTIEYITIASTGNATDFGDLSSNRVHVSSCSNGSRGVFAGGHSDTFAYADTIEYVTIATTSNTTDFGDLTLARNGMAALGNNTRGVFAGGNTFIYSNVIDYIAIATPGNATDFGDLTQGDSSNVGGTNNATRGLFFGGRASSNLDVIEYITIDTPGNTTDFGDLLEALGGPTGISGN